MELLKDNVVFSSSSKVTKWRCKVLLVNFNKALSISNVDGNITKETICEVIFHSQP